MSKKRITLGIAAALGLSGAAGASTVYTFVNGPYSAASPICSAEPTRLGPWEISEGPVDYAPDAYGETQAQGLEWAEFAVMEPTVLPNQGLFLNPVD